MQFLSYFKTTTAILSHYAANFFSENYIISLTLFINTTMYFSWYPVLPIHLRNLGAGDIAIGFIYTILSFGFTLFQFFGGLLADKFGLKKVIVYTTIFSVPAYILMGASSTWVMFMIFIFLAEIFNALQWPSFMLAISEFTRKEELGFAYSIFEASILLAFTAGPALGFFLISFMPISYLMIFTGFVCILTFFIRWIYLKDYLAKQEGKINLSFIKSNLTPKFLVSFLLFTIFGLVMMITIYGPFIAMYSKDVFNFDEKQIQLMIFCGNLFAALVSFMAGWWTDKFGSKFMLGAGLFLQGIFFILWALSGKNSMYAYFVFAVIFVQIASIAKNKLLIEISPQNSKGLFVGLLFTVSGLFGSVSPAAGSYVKKLYGSTAPFYLNFIFGALAVILIILYIIIKNRKQK